MKPPLTKLRLTVLTVIAVGAFICAYAVWIEPDWIEVTHHQINAPLASPIKIAHLTDLHSYGLGSRELKLLDLLEAEKPDIIVITGDSIDTSGQYVGLGEVLRRLHAPLGVWVVRGNHEIWHPVKDERAFYESAGVNYLLNECRQVRNDLWLLGIDDEYAGSPSIDAAAKGVPRDAYKIALFHSPAYFDRAASRSDLALAGHSHGGQVRLPFIGPLWLPPNCNDYISGWYERDGSRMYVSRGIGTSIMRARFLCRPELAIITIQQ